MKKCAGECGLLKPEGDFYVKDKKTGALFPLCKECHKKKCKENYQRNLERNRETRKTYNREHRSEQTEYMRQWRAENAERAREISRRADAKRSANGTRNAYRQRNAERIKAVAAAYRKANRERIRAADAEYRAANAATLAARQRAWREANPAAYREIHRRWKAANKSAVNAATHRRRCRLAGCAGSWTAAEWEALKRAQDHTCLCCGRREPEIKLTFDHVVPVAMGGDNTIANAQGLCFSCNAAKQDTHADHRAEGLVAFLTAVAAAGLAPEDALPVAP